MVSFNDHPRPDVGADVLLGFFVVQLERQGGDVITNRVVALRFRRAVAPIPSLLATGAISSELQPLAFDLELSPPQFPCRSICATEPATRSAVHRVDALIDDMIQGQAGAPLLFYVSARMKFVSHGQPIGPHHFRAEIFAKLLIRV